MLQEAVVRRLGLQTADARRGVVDVAEHDRLRRTGLLAGGGDLAVLDRPVLLLGGDARRVDPLHAVGALLHDAARSHRDIRVPSQLQDRRLFVAVLQEVEAADLVRTVVGAVARPDAAVVDHVVEPLAAVAGGADRADHLARRLLALHAHDRLVVRVRVVGAPFVVAVDAEPLHLAPATHLVLADDRDVVLGHAGHHAGVAAGARGQIDRHTPGVPFGGGSSFLRANPGSDLYSASVPTRTRSRPSMLKCSWVHASAWRFPVLRIDAAGCDHIPRAVLRT